MQDQQRQNLSQEGSMTTMLESRDLTRLTDDQLAEMFGTRDDDALDSAIADECHRRVRAARP